jgi:hypothetical protein
MTVIVNNTVYEFRVPTAFEYKELTELYATCVAVGARTPFIEWMTRQLIVSINSFRVNDIDLSELSEEDSDSIRSAVKDMLCKLRRGKCVVCGALTSTTGTLLCGNCYDKGWRSGAAESDFRRIMTINKQTGTSAWVFKDNKIMYIDHDGDSSTLSL